MAARTHTTTQNLLHLVQVEPAVKHVDFTDKPQINTFAGHLRTHDDLHNAAILIRIAAGRRHHCSIIGGESVATRE